MSIQNLFTTNDAHLFCDTMTCNNIGGNCIHNCSNVGAGSQVFKQLSGTSSNKIAEFRTLTAGSGVTLTQNANDISIAATGSSAPVQSVFARTGNVVATEGDYSLTQLSDVTISAPSNGQVLTYNGSAFVNSAIPNYISTYFNNTPGATTTTVPAGAKLALVSAVGGGAGGVMQNFGGGGGAGGAIANYPISLAAGQTISVNVGAGGGANSAGGNTTITVGTLTLTCEAGQLGAGAAGGAGGSVDLSFGTPIAGGAGGADNTSGANGISGFFSYSGGGGSGAHTVGVHGGNILLFTGGNCNGNGGGGASGFGNGANAGNPPGTPGIGGGGCGGTGGAEGSGSNGFVQIVFTA